MSREVLTSSGEGPPRFDANMLISLLYPLNLLLQVGLFVAGFAGFWRRCVPEGPSKRTLREYVLLNLNELNMKNSKIIFHSISTRLTGNIKYKSSDRKQIMMKFNGCHL